MVPSDLFNNTAISFNCQFSPVTQIEKHDADPGGSFPHCLLNDLTQFPFPQGVSPATGEHLTSLGLRRHQAVILQTSVTLLRFTPPLKVDATIDSDTVNPAVKTQKPPLKLGSALNAFKKTSWLISFCYLPITNLLVNEIIYFLLIF